MGRRKNRNKQKKKEAEAEQKQKSHSAIDWKDEFPDVQVTLSPDVYQQMVYLANAHGTECGGFGISLDPENPFHISKIFMPKQEVGSASIEFDENDIDLYLRTMAEDEGLEFDQFFRLWVHTQPGASVTPSATDYECLYSLLGHIRSKETLVNALLDEDCTLDLEPPLPWMIMLIIAEKGQMSAQLATLLYGRIHISAIGVGVRWPTAYEKKWDEAYAAACTKKSHLQYPGHHSHFGHFGGVAVGDHGPSTKAAPSGHRMWDSEKGAYVYIPEGYVRQWDEKKKQWVTVPSKANLYDYRGKRESQTGAGAGAGPLAKKEEPKEAKEAREKEAVADPTSSNGGKPEPNLKAKKKEK